MSQLIVTGTNENITLYFNGENVVVNKKKSPKIYKEILTKIQGKAPDIKWLETNFKSIKEQIETKSQGLMSVEDGVVVIKGTNIPAPKVLVKKLQELSELNEPIEPLVRFWRHLCTNPSENSRRDLYDFMLKNNIPITEQGFIVTEKGVNQKKGSYVGHLVDVHSGRVDNSVGQVVVMAREDVNPNSTETCSYGLHVGAPDFVRNNWSSDVIVECIVNPRDVVSVPKDYNATKMRVCQYTVMGYSDKTRKGDKVVKLSDFLDTPLPDAQKKMEVKSDLKPREVKEDEKVISEKATEYKESSEPKTIDNTKLIEGMSARLIVDFVKEKTGELITYSLKSKKSIIKKAIQLLDEHSLKETMKELSEDEAYKVEEEIIQQPIRKVVSNKLLNTSEMGKSELLEFAQDKFNEKLITKRSRNSIESKVIDLAIAAGYTITNDLPIVRENQINTKANIKNEK